jgi:hypothetical protein
MRAVRINKVTLIRIGPSFGRRLVSLGQRLWVRTTEVLRGSARHSELRGLVTTAPDRLKGMRGTINLMTRMPLTQRESQEC